MRLWVELQFGQQQHTSLGVLPFKVHCCPSSLQFVPFLIFSVQHWPCLCFLRPLFCTLSFYNVLTWGIRNNFIMTHTCKSTANKHMFSNAYISLVHLEHLPSTNNSKSSAQNLAQTADAVTNQFHCLVHTHTIWDNVLNHQTWSSKVFLQ